MFFKSFVVRKSTEVIPAVPESDLVSTELSDIQMFAADQEKNKLMEENQRLKEALENMEKKFKTENERATTLENEIKKHKAQEICSNKFEKSVEKIFTSGQIRKLKDPHARIVHWTVNDIAHAIALHAAGPRAYRWMQKNNHPLPGESTLRRWANKIDISPGILRFVFKLMGTYDLPEIDKVCVILADEMKIKKSYEYDRNSDTLLKPANYVQVIMARGLFCNWKQPIFYDFDRNLSKSLLFEIIKKLDNIGFNVIGITNDLGGGNRGLWKSLGITEEAPFFFHPTNVNDKIYAFADVPHLVKLIRNHFLDSEFFIHGKKVNKKPLLELFESTHGKDLNIAHKLTTHHLTVKNAGRQKVKFATQLFSHTNSKAISRMGSLGLLKSENWLECANLLKIVSKLCITNNSKLT